jgi:hypothetical protein
MMKKTAPILFFTLVLFLLPFTVVAAGWQDICGSQMNDYCKDVGKNAYNAQGTAFLKKVDLGKITGVAWRPKGSVIGVSPTIPSAGIPEKVRTSPRNAFYYIIDDGGKPFLRQCREINAR